MKVQKLKCLCTFPFPIGYLKELWNNFFFTITDYLCLFSVELCQGSVCPHDVHHSCMIPIQISVISFYKMPVHIHMYEIYLSYCNVLGGSIHEGTLLHSKKSIHYS
jgi:hypothetical protein